MFIIIYKYCGSPMIRTPESPREATTALFYAKKTPLGFLRSSYFEPKKWYLQDIGLKVGPGRVAVSKIQ